MINSIETMRSLIEKEYCILGELVLGIFTVRTDARGTGFLAITNKRLFCFFDSSKILNVIVLHSIDEVFYNYPLNIVGIYSTSGGIFDVFHPSFNEKSDAEEAFKLIMKNLVS